MSFALRTGVGPGKHVLDGGSHPLMGRGNFEGGGKPLIKYSDTLRGHLCKQRLNRSRCRFGFSARIGLRNYIVDDGPYHPWEGVILREKRAPIVKYRDFMP